MNPKEIAFPKKLGIPSVASMYYLFND